MKNKKALVFLAFLVILLLFFIARPDVKGQFFKITGLTTLEDDAANNSVIEIDTIHWDHMPLTFYISSSSYECPDYQIRRIKQAFVIIQNSTNNSVIFKEASDPYADIFISCSKAQKDGFYIRAVSSYYDADGNIMKRAYLTFYKYVNCGIWPDIEINGVLSLLGYASNSDKDSVMNEVFEKCDLGKIDEWIIRDLTETYAG